MRCFFYILEAINIRFTSVFIPNIISHKKTATISEVVLIMF